MAQNDGYIGPIQGTTGPSAGLLRIGWTGEQVVADAHARYQEAVARGRVFGGGTAATGVAPGTAIGTTSAFTLANPASSGVNLVVWKVTMGYVSGTLGAGVIHYVANVNTIAAAVSGTAITPVNMLLGSSNSAAGKPFTTATLPASPTIIRPFASLQASLASTAVAPWQVVDQCDGEFVIGQGAALSLEGTTAAGSSPLVVYGIVWEEIPALT